MRLQYQLSNGSWIDCNTGGDDRTAEFMERCVRFGGLADEAAVLAALSAGKPVRNARDDWYSYCRDGDMADATTARRRAAAAGNNLQVLRCKCGATGRAGAYPFSTLPGSGRCDDCC